MKMYFSFLYYFCRSHFYDSATLYEALPCIALISAWGFKLGTIAEL